MIDDIIHMTESILAEEPSSGMTLVAPEDCTLLLRLCTVMGWKPKIPLHIMRDSSAGRWFMRGMPGAQDYWIRDADIEVLKKTPMWLTVQTAVPYGIVTGVEPKHPTATETELREKVGFKKIKELSEKFENEIGKFVTGADRDDALDMYTALARKAREQMPNTFALEDPVEEEKRELAKRRLAAEAELRKLDEWE